LELSFWIVRRKKSPFARSVAARLDQQILAVPRLIHPKVEAFILFLVNNDILRWWVPKTMPKQMIMPFRNFVLGGIKQSR
jgi:hypothetical protein